MGKSNQGAWAGGKGGIKKRNSLGGATRQFWGAHGRGELGKKRIGGEDRPQWRAMHAGGSSTGSPDLFF